MTSNDRTISVVVVLYNTDERFVRECLESVLSQEPAADEVLVVDDGSKVAPTWIATDFPQVRLHVQANTGVGGSRDAGRRLATSSYVMFCDGDDRLCPGALAILAAPFDSQPDLGFVAGRSIVIDETSTVTSGQQLRVPPENADYFDLIKRSWICPPSSVLFRAEALAAVGGTITASSLEDWDALLRVGWAYPFVALDDVVTDYRRHGTNVSNNLGFMIRAGWGQLNMELRKHPDDSRVREAVREGKRHYRSLWARGAANETIRRCLDPQQWRHPLALLSDSVLVGRQLALLGIARIGRLPVPPTYWEPPPGVVAGT